MSNQESDLSVVELKQAIEWKLCEQDVVYFLENFYYITEVGKGASLFKLRDYQKEILDSLIAEEYLISLKARQIGMTTLTMGFALWYALFHPNAPWLLISRGEGAAKKMLARAKLAFLKLPQWMRDRVSLTSDTQTILEFDNGSYLESLPATGGTGRGDSVYGAILDECAWMENAEEIWAAVEPLVYGKSVLISTANGMGDFFHETWLDSQRHDSVWFGMFFPWHVVPNRDAEWYERKRMAQRNQPWLFYQEYPADPSEAFAKSGRTAYPQELIDYNDFAAEYIPVTYESFHSNPADRFIEVEDEDAYDVIIKVWKEPEVIRDEDNFVAFKPNYVVSCDVAEGMDHGDYSVIKVFDVNTYEEVASCRTHYAVEDLGQLLEDIGYLYHAALIGVERNNHGLVPLTYLSKAGYPRLYRTKPIARRGSNRRQEYGWRTTSASKPKMIKDLSKMFKDQSIMIHDDEFRMEANVFVADGKGSYNATHGNHDDVVIATAIGGQLLLESERFPVVWVDMDDHPVTFEEFFTPQKKNARSILDQPIGQARVGEKASAGIFLKPENHRQIKR